MEKKIMIRSSSAEFLIFKLHEKDNGINVRYNNRNLWLNQKAMAELFDCSVDNISLHLKNVFNKNEVDVKSAIEESSVTAKDGKNYKTKFYNLETVISVGYRVNSMRASQFRKWATDILKTFSIQGYVIDKERMKNGAFIDEDYFEKLLEEIREIRLSERRFYQKVTDIYATSIDYDKNSKITIAFFKKVQNKMHYAVSKQTAAEIVYNRVDSEKENMGLTTYKNAPTGKILKSDVIIAKNYLNKEELEDLQRIVNAFLELAEGRAKKNIPMTMEDWAFRIDKFLLGDDRDILKDAGKISHEIMTDKALTEFEKYRIKQDKLYKSDFDEFLKLENKVEESQI